jgi:hypothetical protein
MASPGKPLARPAPSSNALDLSPRRCTMLWANGQGLDGTRCSRGTALMRHGFAEWAGAIDQLRMPPKRHAPDPIAWSQEAGTWLAQAIEDNTLPVGLFSDVETAVTALAAAPTDQATAWVAFGSPAQHRLESTARVAPDFPSLPAAAAAIVARGAGRHWLAAPRRLAETLDPLLAAGLRVDGRRLRAHGIDQALWELDQRLLAQAPGRLCALVFLDDLDLGDAGEGPCVMELARLLRWLQSHVFQPCVLLVGSEPADGAAPCGEIARRLGLALHRHPRPTPIVAADVGRSPVQTREAGQGKPQAPAAIRTSALGSLDQPG